MMNLQAQLVEDVCSVDGILTDLNETLWMDGFDGQEDELEDVAKGKLKSPTDDKGAGEIFESNKGDVALQKADEDALPDEPMN